ncbi:hypothetical protein HKX48_000124, partial [Thoreauomyces humboldtii]
MICAVGASWGRQNLEMDSESRFWIQSIQTSLVSMLASAGGLFFVTGAPEGGRSSDRHTMLLVYAVISSALGALGFLKGMSMTDNVEKIRGAMVAVTVCAGITLLSRDTLAISALGSVTMVPTWALLLSWRQPKTISLETEKLNIKATAELAPFDTSGKRSISDRKLWAWAAVASVNVLLLAKVSQMAKPAQLHAPTRSIPILPVRPKLPPFNISESALPREIGDNKYDQPPMHSARPQNQFYTPADLMTKRSIITIMTPSFNPTELLRDVTARAILQMSFQEFEWDIARMDPRIRVVKSTKKQGVAGARAMAIEQVRTPYQVFMDDDDQFELTSLEQALWLLEGNPQLHLAGFYTVYFGARRHNSEIG